MKKNHPTVVKLRNFVHDEYPIGNDEGRHAYQALAKFVDDNPDEVNFGISLDGIKGTDASFPRESVVTLAKANSGKKGFYLQDFATKDLIDNWHYAAQAKEQPLLIWHPDGKYQWIGPRLKAEPDFIAFILKKGIITTAMISKEFDLTTQNASNKLKALYNQGVITGTKEIAESGGLEFVYRAIKP